MIIHSLNLRVTLSDKAGFELRKFHTGNTGLPLEDPFFRNNTLSLRVTLGDKVGFKLRKFLTGNTGLPLEDLFTPNNTLPLRLVYKNPCIVLFQ